MAGVRRLGQAIELARIGYLIFPLLPGRRVPPKHMRFKELATRDPEQIRAWWTENPDYNIGIYTGRYAGEGGEGEGALLVVDVDVKKGKPGLASLARLELELLEGGTALPATAEQRTASGGRHLLFAVAQAFKQGANVLGPGLDIRSRGGYIVGPGSVVDGVEYRWLNGHRSPAPAPAALISRLPKEGVKGDGADPGSGGAGVVANGGGIGGVVATLGAGSGALWQAIDYVSGTSDVATEWHGGNDTTYRVAAQLRSFGLSFTDACAVMQRFYNPRCRPRWPREELLKIVRNAYQYGTGRPGEDAPGADFTPANPLLAHHRQGEGVRAGFEATRHYSWLVKGLIVEGLSLVCLYGPPKTFKSFIALDLLLHIAAGLPYHGRATKARAVLYIAAEGQVGVFRRVMAWAQSHGVPVPEDFHIITRPVLLDGPGLNELYAAVALLEQQTGKRFEIIAFDTLAKSMSGDENSTQDMGRVVNRCVTLSKRTGATVWVVHHSGKDPSKGARGSMALLGGVDLEFRVTLRDGLPTLHCPNAREQEKADSLTFELERVDLGLSSDLEPIVSLVPKLVCAPSAARELTPQQARALDILQALVRKTGAAVAVDDWRIACRYELTEGGGDAQKKAFKRAKDKLVDLRLVTIADDHAEVS